MTKHTLILAALVAAIVMTTVTAMAAPCHPGHRRTCKPARPKVVVIVDSESSKIRLVRVEGIIDQQSATINAAVDAHNHLVGRVEQNNNASVSRDAAIRADLDREVGERKAVDADLSDLILEGIEVDEEIDVKATEAEAKAAEAKAKAEKLERELRALKNKKEK